MPHDFVFTASDDLLTCSKNVAFKVSSVFVVWKEPCKGWRPGGSITLQPVIGLSLEYIKRSRRSTCTASFCVFFFYRPTRETEAHFTAAGMSSQTNNSEALRFKRGILPRPEEQSRACGCQSGSDEDQP
jgi:hypothetical protein